METGMETKQNKSFQLDSTSWLAYFSFYLFFFFYSIFISKVAFSPNTNKPLSI